MATSDDVLAAIRAGDLETLDQLVGTEPASATARDEHGVSALMNALYRGRDDMVNVLLGAGLNLDLFEAAAVGHSGRVQSLLGGDPDAVNSFSPDGFTPLHLACFFRQQGVVRALLAAGADPALVSRNNMRVQPLHSAVAARQPGIVRLLLEAGAPVNAAQHGGWTALHAAAQHGDLEVVDLLLNYGADAALVNDEGKSPAHLAAAQGNERLVRRLEPNATRRKAAG